MIAKLLKNFEFEILGKKVPDECVVDFNIFHNFCPVCGKEWKEVKIYEFRPLASGDQLPSNHNNTVIILSYNTPSPKGSLGERYRSNSVKLYDVWVKGLKALAIVDMNAKNNKSYYFLLTKRYYNPDLWNCANTLHIYEDHCDARILWGELEDIQEIDEKEFLIKQEKVNRKCLENTRHISIALETVFEWEDKDYVLFVSHKHPAMRLSVGKYSIKELEERLNLNLLDSYIRSFNTDSRWFQMIKYEQHIILTRK